MIIQTLLSFALVLLMANHPMAAGQTVPGTMLASHEFSLAKRYGNTFVNEVFADNIRLTLAVIQNGAPLSKPIDWDSLRRDMHVTVPIEPGTVFAFHDNVLPSYKEKRLVVIPAHYNAQEGFKSDGLLFGDGVCHFASLIHWAARDAGLHVEANVNHNFANIPEVPRTYGVSILAKPFADQGSALQNLYITNDRIKPIVLVFDLVGDILRASIVEQ